MKAAAVVVAALAATGQTTFATLRSDPPLLLRPTPGALQLVGGAAGPLGGDQLSYDLTLEPDAAVTVRSVAASMALPGPGPEPSTLDIAATVGSGASLDWRPEPLISVTGSDHHQHTEIQLDRGSTLRWQESLVLGRSDEDPGALRSVLRVIRAGRPLTHQALHIGDGAEGWDGPAGIDRAGAIISVVAVGPGPHDTESITCGDARAARFRLSEDASLSMALASTIAEARHTLDELGP